MGGAWDRGLGQGLGTGAWDRGQVTVSHNWDTDLTPVPTPVYFSLICLLTCALNRFHSFS